MELYYYKDEIGNFGDDLNPWLWSQLLPEYLNNDPSELFVGIGTLLNHKLPNKPRKYIFGSGAGYGKPPIVDEKWEIFALRGPYTAKTLNLDKDYIITDSAILISKIVAQIDNTQGDIGFMPHYISHRLADWQNIAETCGLRYISPEASVSETLDAMKQCKVIYTEAMHGAIVADSLRLPWHPLILGDHVNTDKWIDWLSTIKLDYCPTSIPSIFNAERNLSIKNKVKNEVKRQIIQLGFGQKFHSPPPRKSKAKDRSATCYKLMECINRKEHFLSTSETQNKLLKQYDTALEKFKTRIDAKS